MVSATGEKKVCCCRISFFWILHHLHATCQSEVSIKRVWLEYIINGEVINRIWLQTELKNFNSFYLCSVAIVAMTANQTHHDENGTIAVVSCFTFSSIRTAIFYFNSIKKFGSNENHKTLFSILILHGIQTPKGLFLDLFSTDTSLHRYLAVGWQQGIR